MSLLTLFIPATPVRLGGPNRAPCLPSRTGRLHTARPRTARLHRPAVLTLEPDDDPSSVPSSKPADLFPPPLSSASKPSKPASPPISKPFPTEAESSQVSEVNDDSNKPFWRRVLEDDQFDDLRTFGLAFALAVLLRTFVVEPRYIPSLSMYPTFDIGDQFLVDKLTRAARAPQRGDIVVFEPPPALIERGYRRSDAFIKRLIARSGDTVYVHDGVVEVNGEQPSEPFINERPSYDWGPGVVPEGFVMVLGDNRNNSYDSHVWGFLPEQNIIGRAIVRYWPPARFGTLD